MLDAPGRREANLEAESRSVPADVQGLHLGSAAADRIQKMKNTHLERPAARRLRLAR